MCVFVYYIMRMLTFWYLGVCFGVLYYENVYFLILRYVCFGVLYYENVDFLILRCVCVCLMYQKLI